MNYYYDTEFLEGTQTKRTLGIPVGKTVPTIDLISIGIVSEDDREYYAISNEFNLKEAWNRFDLIDSKKAYWIRENVLKPIFWELCLKEDPYQAHGMYSMWETPWLAFRELKHLIKKHGKSKKQIGKEIVEFCNGRRNGELLIEKFNIPENLKKYSDDIILHAYYGAYDHVAFCWVFGKMMNLPKGFPMYSRDLKQILDESVEKLPKEFFQKLECDICKHNVLEYLEMTGEAFTLNFRLKKIKEKHLNYPTQDNAHNALDDAKWNKKLHEFIQSI